jgi:hypothetical protein
MAPCQRAVLEGTWFELRPGLVHIIESDQALVVAFEVKGDVAVPVDGDLRPRGMAGGRGIGWRRWAPEKARRG